MKKRLTLLILFGFLFIGACTRVPLLQQQASPTPPQTPTSSAPVLPTPTPRVIYVTPRATLVDPVCVTPGDPDRLEQQPFQEYPQAILEYLNSGPTLEELDKSLADLGIANLPLSAAEADLTGDGKLDRIVSIINPLSETIPPSGSLLIFTCRSGTYELTHQRDSTASDTQPPRGAPGIRFVQDLDADDLAEVVSTSPICGASTCFESLYVWGWDGAAFTNRLEGSSDDLPFPELRIADSNGNGIFNLEVLSSGSGSVGAGPTREVLRLWTFHPGEGKWIKGEDLLQESSYRIHVLHDADRLAADSRYEDALRQYRRVYAGGALQDFTDPLLEQANLGAYARYRELVLLYRLGQITLASAALQDLDELFPAGSAQRPYVDMARQFAAGFIAGGISEGCRAAQNFASSRTEEILEPLGSQAFGYANRDYEPQDVCPW